MGIFVFPSFFLVIGDGIGYLSTDLKVSRCLTGDGESSTSRDSFEKPLRLGG